MGKSHIDDRVFAEGVITVGVMVTPAKSTVSLKKSEFLSIDDNTTVCTECQIIPHMMESLLNGVVVQEHIINNFSPSIATFD